MPLFFCSANEALAQDASTRRKASLTYLLLDGGELGGRAGHDENIEALGGELERKLASHPVCRASHDYPTHQQAACGFRTRADLPMHRVLRRTWPTASLT